MNHVRGVISGATDGPMMGVPLAFDVRATDYAPGDIRWEYVVLASDPNAGEFAGLSGCWWHRDDGVEVELVCGESELEPIGYVPSGAVAYLTAEGKLTTSPEGCAFQVRPHHKGANGMQVDTCEVTRV